MQNEIVFCKKDEETKEELFRRVGEQLRFLLEEDYLAVVRYDEPGLGIIVIEFEHDEHFGVWGCNQPIWVTPKEEEQIAFMRTSEK